MATIYDNERQIAEDRFPRSRYFFVTNVGGLGFYSAGKYHWYYYDEKEGGFVKGGTTTYKGESTRRYPL